MDDRYCVFGNPVGHSLSPRIHGRFARETGQAIDYTTRECPLDAFPACVQAFHDEGGLGANVTLPFKEQAFRLAEACTERARKAGAVNTLIRTPGGWMGDNTDGAGLMADLARLRFPVRGMRVLILGAGGVVRGILHPLLEQQPALIHIANRTPERAAELAVRFRGPIETSGLDALARLPAFDLILHGISAGHTGTLPAYPASLVQDVTRCYDLSYGKAARPFLRWAAQSGAFKTADGLGMLVEQAAEAFRLWRGVRPRTEPVLRDLRTLEL